MNYTSVKIRMRVRFNLRKSRLNQVGKCPIDCRVRINGISTPGFSTSIMVEPVKWNSKAQVIIGSSDEVVKQNKRLAAIRLGLEEIFDLNLAQKKQPTAKEVVDQFQGKSKTSFNYSDLCGKYEQNLRLRGRKKSTLERYSRCYAYLGDFLKTDLPVSLIDRAHVTGFWIWLKKKGLKNDYCNKVVQPCIGLFLFAIREGYIDRSPFASVRLEWDRHFDRTCLSHEEVDLIKNKQWSDTLQRVVDSFLFMCYTGLHISDYQSVTETNRYNFQGMEFMRVKRFKTKVEAMFPLDQEVLRIIEKYKGIDNLPRLSTQKSNSYLKLIAESVGITKNLTNKVARKTFTDRCLNDHCLSDEVVAVMLGHTSTKQLKHYGTIKERRVLKEWKGKAEIHV